MTATEEPATLLKTREHRKKAHFLDIRSSLSEFFIDFCCCAHQFFSTSVSLKIRLRIISIPISTWKLELSSSYSLTHVHIYYFVVYPRPVGIRIFFGRYHVRGDVRGRKWLDPRCYLTSSRPNRRHKSQRDKTSRMEPLASSSHRKRELSRHFP